MKRTLRTEGFAHRRPFKVEGGLVSHYNRALFAAVGKTTELESFTIDKRGESPEIEQELGDNYLQRGPSDRYLIVVSPQQREADLMHEEFSFDADIIDALYDQFLSGMSVATRVDGLWGELDDHLRVLDGLEDLLLLERVAVQLRTPSGFLTRARELQQAVQQLHENPNLLVDDSSRHLHRIHELVELVGDVRNFNIAHIRATVEIGSFHTRLFDGVHVFRVGRPTVAGHRPEQPLDPSAIELGPRTTVIYSGRAPRRKAPAVDFIPLTKTSKIVDFLLGEGLAEYSEGLVGRRLAQLEDEVLAEAGFDLTGYVEYSRGPVERGLAELPSETRRRHASSGGDPVAETRHQAVNRLHERMPDAWGELIDIQRGMALGNPFVEVVKKRKVDVRKMLLEPVPDAIPSDVLPPTQPRPAAVVESLLTKLWPHDFAIMYRANRRDLEHLFEEAPVWKQECILNVLRQEIGEPS